ncbi:MAG: ATP-binding protein, partial [Proteobacteria bacterium]|nr:ATP-binding protein [Pseudomonadota bacterium]
GIQDRGPGIPEQFATQVLEPFFQMDPARTGNTKARGFGLGLSIVDEIVRDHGGQLEFENTAPRGLSVRIILPKASPRTSD